MLHVSLLFYEATCSLTIGLSARLLCVFLVFLFSVFIVCRRKLHVWSAV